MTTSELIAALETMPSTTTVVVLFQQAIGGVLIEANIRGISYANGKVIIVAPQR